MLGGLEDITEASTQKYMNTCILVYNVYIDLSTVAF